MRVLTIRGDFGSESLALALSQASIYRHTITSGGLAADSYLEAAGHFLSHSPVQYRAMKGFYDPQWFGGTPKGPERVPQNEAGGSCRHSMHEAPSAYRFVVHAKRN